MILPSCLYVGDILGRQSVIEGSDESFALIFSRITPRFLVDTKSFIPKGERNHEMLFVRRFKPVRSTSSSPLNE
ncbi:hypothetical protein GTNG_2273 [Geobacillus thermodenitrificans NG80-2]|uniref:Uncharacterized protein n=1 Tax=Geobacillus thermodenitrificans (strain NG80-2) TaxID=420246 RepID=A4IQL8_GEOTN|nr:hypothetical protein GTNG_2273 [Geobacillus thermodenitrificans NG80-2]